MQILVLTKRQYMNKDVLDDRYGRLWELPAELARRGHDVRGLCLSYRKRRSNRVQEGSLQWDSINATALKLPGLLRYIARASSQARQCDVIWAGSDSIYGIIGYLLGVMHRRPVIFDLYDNFGSFLAARLPVIRELYRWALRHCDAVTCNGNALAGLVRSYGRRKRIDVIPTTSRLDLFRPMDRAECRRQLGLPLEAKIVGTAGAIYRNRGIDHLIAACQTLSARHPEVYLALAGPREKEFDVLRSDHILDLGALPYEQVPVFLNALDVAVIGNVNSAFGHYSFPQKTWEIMACDVPLVAAAVKGMSAFFKDHPEWLYDPANSDDLARALEHRLLSDRATGYGRAPSWSELAARLEQIMFELLAERSARVSPA